MSFIHDLSEHIIDTKSQKYCLNNNLEVKDILFSIPIPYHCKTLGDAYFLASIIRRIVSYIADGDKKEALKMAHELSMVYEREKE